MSQNNLNTYSDSSDFFKEYKKMIKWGIIASIIIVFSMLILCVFINKTFPLIIGYLIGSLTSFILLFVTYKKYTNSYYGDYGKVTKKIHWIHQIVYGVIFVVSMIIYLNPFLLLGLVLGLLIIKIISFIMELIKKHK